MDDQTDTQDEELERGDETPTAPEIGSAEWFERMRASENELKQLIREHNEWRRSKRL
jgi:hypothetical protein